MEKINLWDELCLFNDHFNPNIIAELNGQKVKLVKFQGQGVWQKYENGDELFMIILGKITMQFKDREILVCRGEILVVPHGVDHSLFAEEEAWVMLIRHTEYCNPS